jgi:hypothetical protein
LSRKSVDNWLKKFSRTFESRRWCPTTSPDWDCDRSNCATGERVDSSWQEDNDRQCSNCTKMLLLFNKQHKARSLEILEGVRMVGAQRTEGSRRN